MNFKIYTYVYKRNSRRIKISVFKFAIVVLINLFLHKSLPEYF